VLDGVEGLKPSPGCVTRSPDCLWTLIMTGVSQHIKHNAETLRSVLVQHKKKKTLVVEDNNLVMGESTPRDWELVTQMIFEELQKDVTHPSLKSVFQELVMTGR